MYSYIIEWMNEELYFDGRKFIPTKKAAQMTGYATDYIGQLSRLGKVSSKIIGRVKFIDEGAILAYKAASDEHKKKIAQDRSIQFKKEQEIYSPFVGARNADNASPRVSAFGNALENVSEKNEEPRFFVSEEKEESITTVADTAQKKDDSMPVYSFGGINKEIFVPKVAVPKSFTLEEEPQLAEDHALMPRISLLPSLFFTHIDSSVVKDTVLSVVAGILFLSAYTIAPGIYTKDGIVAVASVLKETIAVAIDDTHASFAVVAKGVYKNGSVVENGVRNVATMIAGRGEDKKALLISDASVSLSLDTPREIQLRNTIPVLSSSVVQGIPFAYAELFSLYINALHSISSRVAGIERIVVVSMNDTTDEPRALFATTLHGIPNAYEFLIGGYVHRTGIVSLRLAGAEVQYVEALKSLFSSPLALSDEVARFATVSGGTLSAVAAEAIDATKESSLRTGEHIAKITYRKITSITEVLRVTFKSSREGAFIFCAGNTCIMRGDIVK